MWQTMDRDGARDWNWIPTDWIQSVLKLFSFFKNKQTIWQKHWELRVEVKMMRWHHTGGKSHHRRGQRLEFYPKWAKLSVCALRTKTFMLFSSVIGCIYLPNMISQTVSYHLCFCVSLCLCMSMWRFISNGLLNRVNSALNTTSNTSPPLHLSTFE
jgi:hypothetical protein